MIYLIAVSILIVSVLMALWSLKKQKKIEEVKVVKKELKKGRVIFNQSSD